MALNRESILGASDFKTKSVHVPEWGGDVLVRSLSGSARDEIEAAFLSGETKGLKALVVSLSACDESGVLLFKRDDMDQLQERSAAALERVFDAAWEISGLGAGAVKDAEGN